MHRSHRFSDITEPLLFIINKRQINLIGSCVCLLLVTHHRSLTLKYKLESIIIFSLWSSAFPEFYNLNITNGRNHDNPIKIDNSSAYLASYRLSRSTLYLIEVRPLMPVGKVILHIKDFVFYGTPLI